MLLDIVQNLAIRCIVQLDPLAGTPDRNGGLVSRDISRQDSIKFLANVENLASGLDIPGNDSA